MLPQFPQFKPLELTDKEDIENFTKNFPPYSDFSFSRYEITTQTFRLTFL